MKITVYRLQGSNAIVIYTVFFRWRFSSLYTVKFRYVCRILPAPFLRCIYRTIPVHNKMQRKHSAKTNISMESNSDFLLQKQTLYCLSYFNCCMKFLIEAYIYIHTYIYIYIYIERSHLIYVPFDLNSNIETTNLVILGKLKIIYLYYIFI